MSRETITGKEFVKIFEEETGIVLKKAEDKKEKLSDSSSEDVPEENDIDDKTSGAEKQLDGPVGEEQENTNDGI